jgi:hypothetical protein
MATKERAELVPEDDGRHIDWSDQDDAATGLDFGLPDYHTEMGRVRGRRYGDVRDQQFRERQFCSGEAETLVHGPHISLP